MNGNGSITIPASRAERSESVSAQIRQLAGEFKVRMNHDSLTPEFVGEVIADYQNRGVLHDAFSIEAIQALSEIEGMQMDIREAVTRHVSALQTVEDVIGQALTRTRAIDREKFEYRKQYCDPRKNYLLPQRVKSGIVEVYDLLASTPGAREKFLLDYHFTEEEIMEWKQKKERRSNGEGDNASQKTAQRSIAMPPAVQAKAEQRNPIEQAIYDALQNVAIDHALFWRRRKMNNLINAKLPKFVKIGVVQIFDAVAGTLGSQEYLLEHFKFRREEIEMWRQLSEQSSATPVSEKQMNTATPSETALTLPHAQETSVAADEKPRPTNVCKQAIYDALQTIDIQNKQRFWRRRYGVSFPNARLHDDIKIGMVQLFDAIEQTPGAQEYLLTVYKFTREEIELWRGLAEEPLAAASSEQLETVDAPIDIAATQETDEENPAFTQPQSPVTIDAANGNVEPAEEAHGSDSDTTAIMDMQTPVDPSSEAPASEPEKSPGNEGKPVRTPYITRQRLPSFISASSPARRPSIKSRDILNKDVLQRVHMVVEGDEQMEEAWHLTQLYARGNMVMLYRGERGTGKELFPRAVHQLTKNGNKFLAVNCAGFNDGVVESELFGHEKGAYTDARVERDGAFGHVADGGTLLLDEVGDMPLNQQAKLLRVLQNRQFNRVGSNKMIDISPQTKIIAATNRDLEQLVEDGKFRSDLYDRLRGCQIFIPPLRERDESHRQALVKHFLNTMHKADCIFKLSDDALQYMLQHDYPGNVRELKDHIERSCLIAQSDVSLNEQSVTLSLEHVRMAEDMSSVQMLRHVALGNREDWASYFNGALQISESCDPSDPDPTINFTVRLRGVDQNIKGIMEAMMVKVCSGLLGICGNNQSVTAEILGITRGSLRNKLRMKDVFEEEDRKGK
ncbi:MAG TPA: sigma 54-interacting transcriptional regulator [Candidatus Peribacteraceae bacterium]|nr:sigma 54-interacting transcriptional regulator [Candidatus Peribacteraceae bacterium]